MLPHIEEFNKRRGVVRDGQPDPGPPTDAIAPKAGPVVPQGLRQKSSEDTERTFMGKPPIHNAMPEDAAGPLADAQPDSPIGAPPTPGAPPMGDGDGDEQAPDVQTLAAENMELKSRLDAIEQHLGIGKKPDMPMPPHDSADDEYSG